MWLRIGDHSTSNKKLKLTNSGFRFDEGFVTMNEILPENGLNESRIFEIVILWRMRICS